MKEQRFGRPGGRATRSAGCRHFRHAARAAAVTMLAVMFAALLPMHPAAAQDGIRVVGYLDRRTGTDSIGANGNLLIDPVTRRGYQASSQAGETTLYETNLDTLALISSTSIPSLQWAFPALGPVEWQWTLDTVHHRIIALGHASDPQTRNEAYPLMTIDVNTKQVKQSPPLWITNVRIPLSITYDAKADRVYIMTRATVDAARRSTFFLEERTIEGSLDWEYRLSSCFAATDEQYAPVLARSVLMPGYMYLNCYNAGALQAQVIRLTLGATGPVRQEVFPAVPGPLSAMFDPGSDRMFFLTTNGGAGRGAWVFDGLRSSFLGVIASGDARAGASDYAMGLDAATGRLYMETPAGLVLADARRTPLPSGLLFRDLAGFGIGAIHSDPVSHHVFVQDPGSRNQGGQPTRYLVLQDQVALSSDPKSGDPDSLTANVAEQDGKTRVNYSGGARAFGVRALTTGGIQKLAWNAALGTFSPETAGFATVYGAILAVPADQSNRDLYLSRVRQASLSNDSADASAIISESDAGTQRDLARAGETWPATAADCHDDGRGIAPSNSPGASSECSVQDAKVQATATLSSQTNNSGSVTPAGISAGSATSSGLVYRDPVKGLVSHSIAVVRNLSIEGRVWIAEARAEATTQAKGRPGTASATFERRLTGVRVDTKGDGTIDYSCTVCDAARTAAAIREALAGQATVEFPQPDPSFFPAGSARGYQAIVQKEMFRGFAERSLNDDASPEVPALQIVYYSDANAGRSRQVVQIAGVQSESHYGIYAIPAGSGPVVCTCPAVPPRPAACACAPASPPRFTPIVRHVTPKIQTVIERIVHRIAHGTMVAISSVNEALRFAALWLLLFAPAYLIWRRRFVGMS